MTWLLALLSCRPCLYVLAVVASLGGAWWHGHHTAVLACREAELQAVVRNQRIDLEIANKATVDEANRAIEIEVNASEQRKKDAEYIASLKAIPACALTDADLLFDGPRPGGKNPPGGSK